MRYDATTPRMYKDREGNEKTTWVRLGTAFERDGKITILLDALPLPDAQGACKIMLMEPKQNGQNRGATGNRPIGADRREFQRASNAGRDLDDDVPF